MRISRITSLVLFASKDPVVNLYVVFIIFKSKYSQTIGPDDLSVSALLKHNHLVKMRLLLFGQSDTGTIICSSKIAHLLSLILKDKSDCHQ